MKATTFNVEGLVKGYLRGTAWHCTYYTPAGRQRLKLGTNNKRQAERRARETSDLIQREAWDDLDNLSSKLKPQAGTLATFIRDEFEPNYAPWGPRTRKGNAARLRIICRQFGSRPLGSLTAREVKTWLAHRQADNASAATRNRYLSVLKGASIEKHVTLHSSRHQIATRALGAGVANFHLQAIGGWKLPVMLQRYGKVRNRALHEQMAKLNRLSEVPKIHETQ